MAHWQSTPKRQKTFAAVAAVLVTAAILSAPAIAATTVPVPSDVPEDDIEAVSSASLLAPQAEAAIRDAFKDSANVSELQSSKDTESSDSISTRPVAGAKYNSHTTVNSDDGTMPIREMNTKLPGVSDVASSSYKKQMFRRDI
jgi:hypothetical protein